ncbi:MAG TPA: undecaprenyldiphospho-muramoylpentapeptide beta-N-acetylglucosaminyltransferase [Bacteroidota bacterium]|nr:undecaprenyldiphospho-muramoylpentapeptide beta-N-acetylglucosaminyltransferase [Bacteroidota bacterium]
MHAGRLRLVMAGGGTGGHLYPALAIADELRRRHPEAAITFAGAAGRIESRVVPASGYPFVALWVSGFRRRLSIGTLLFPVKLAVALCQSLALIVRAKPDVVVGTGGFASGPVVAAAQLMGRKTLLQEQNSIPGATTRMLARRANEVHVTFEDSVRFLPRRATVRVTGNPTRRQMGTVSRSAAAAHFGLDPGRRTLLVFGGSRGAASINAATAAALGTLAGDGVQVIWQTGEEAFPGLRASLAGRESGVKMFPFIERMEYAYAACDLAVCRAGATSLAELQQSGVPSILIPYPHAAADHQTGNARAMEAAGAAICLSDGEAAQGLLTVVRELLGDPIRLKAMGDAARRMARPGAAAAIADAVERLAHGG